MATSALPAAAQRRSGIARGNGTLGVAGIVLLAAVVIQGVLDPGFGNVVSAAVAATITMLTWVYAFGMNRLRTHPLSTLALLGLNFVTTGEAILFQTLWLRPITFNLQSPLSTFWASACYTLAALGAHLAYTHNRRLERASALLARRVWAPLWTFYPPSNFQLWIVGGAGLAATVYSRAVYGGTIGYGDVGGKFLQALFPFIGAPFFALLRDRLTAASRRPRPGLTPLVAYFFAIVGVAVLMNARGVFAAILLLVLLSYALAIGTGRLVLRGRALAYMAAAGIAMIPVALGAQDLATAMVIARDARSTQNLSYVVRETISAYGDKAALARYRSGTEEALSTGGANGYSESYFASEFLQRLSLTKFTDLTITVSRDFTAEDRVHIRRIVEQQMLALLPTPVLGLIGSTIDKNDLGFSTGDVYENIASSRRVGARLTGSSVTTVRDLSPWFWPAIVVALAIAIFVVCDSLTIGAGGMWSLSVPGYLLVPTIFQSGLAADSLASLVALVTRVTLTIVLVYAVLAFAGRVLERAAIPYFRPAA